MEQLFYSNSLKEYILSDTNRVCDKCGELLLEAGFSCVYLREIGRTFDDIKIYCLTCAPKVELNPFTKFLSKNYARICRQIPEDAVLIIPNKATIQNVGKMHETFIVDSGLISFDEGNINKNFRGAIIDKTKLAGRESWGEAQIGMSINSELEHLDKPLEIDEGLNLLEELGSSEVILSEYQNKNLLDDNLLFLRRRGKNERQK